MMVLLCRLFTGTDAILSLIALFLLGYKMVLRFIHFTLLGTSILMLGACSSKNIRNDKDIRVNRIAYQQLAPEPVYNRLRWVHLPAVKPVRNLATVEGNVAPRIMPVVHLSLQNTRLNEAAQILGSTMRYHAYCASSIMDEVISIEMLGTVDELARVIETKANVKVLVDHNSRSIRFIKHDRMAPHFFDSATESEGNAL